MSVSAAKDSSGEPKAGAIREAAALLAENVGQVMVGMEDTIELVTVALLCQGHLLLEDVPGVGKTTLAKAVARSLNCSFKRIQFTPDILPSDVTGVNYFNQKSGEFQFIPGPILANVVLADEINRATPRTQSCLLEAMAEGQVTIDSKTVGLPRPFLVLATQNPVELEGTFPLPEAQLDRFLMRLRQGYPTAAQEEEVLLRFEHADPMEQLGPVLEGEKLLELAAACRMVHVEQSVREYLVGLVRASREHAQILLGGSPRASQGLYKASQALAALKGRAYVLPDDIKRLAVPVLAHRLILNSEARLKGVAKEEVVADILDSTPAPAE